MKSIQANDSFFFLTVIACGACQIVKCQNSMFCVQCDRSLGSREESNQVRS